MPKFDVFLSHNSVDKPWVIKLKDDLQRYGLSVWLDRDEIRPGDLFAAALEDGLANSRAVALIVSPEAMASGWVKEEYYRALSLTKDKASPLQLIPVILRTAEVPDFLKSRNWVDFRDELDYAQSLWKLVWGITGQKPPEALDLTAPPTPARPAEASASTLAQAAPPTPTEPVFRSGGIKAGGNIQADNIVTGVQVQGADADTARALLALAQNIQTGSVEAVKDIIAKNIVTGFQYLGQGGGELTREQFQQELAALRQQLGQAIAAGEIEDEYEAEDAQKAIDRAIQQSQAEQPVAEKIAQQLDAATTIIERAAKTTQAAGKFGATVIKLAPIAAALKQLVELFF
jgi:hypothetical protein